MKTAEELFHKYADHWEIRPDGSDLTKSIVIEDFAEALAERDAEIKAEIDEMIETKNQALLTKRLTAQAFGSVNMTIMALTALKEKL